MNHRIHAQGSTEPAFHLRGSPGGIATIRLTVHSRLVATAVLRPVVDDWVLPNGEIVAADARVAPAYCSVLRGGDARATITLALPESLGVGQRLRSTLRFPGADEDLLPLELEIVEPPGDAGAIWEHQISVTLPITPYTGDTAGASGAGTRAIYTLIAGLSGLEIIPARWLASELVGLLCEIGTTFMATPEGTDLLGRVSRTRFYKNGVLAFQGAQIPQWMLTGLAISSGLHAALGGRREDGRILSMWERWLYSLVDADLESPLGTADEPLMPPVSDDTASALGTDPERWFAALLMGLTSLVPRVRSVVEAVCAEAPAPPESASPPETPPPNDVLSEGGSLIR